MVSRTLIFLGSCKDHVAGIGTTTTAKFVTMLTAEVRDHTNRLSRQVSSSDVFSKAMGKQARELRTMVMMHHATTKM